MSVPAHLNAPTEELDVLIVGAGFSGCCLLHKLRDELNLNVKIFETGSSLGGTWHWNRYPGARVDCPVPGYEFSMEGAWKHWTWKEKYPSWEELQAYFIHIDKELSISKDCYFNHEVVSAQFLSDEQKWAVTTRGRVILTKWLIPAIGFAAKQYVPDWKGLETFRGKIYHSSAWPEEGVNVEGQKVAVIGTGSTGIQIGQQWAKDAAETFVFQRTPNTCLPMRQEKLDVVQQKDRKSRLALFANSRTTFGGLPYDYVQRNSLVDSPDEREATYERLYEEGGLKLWNGSYKDLMVTHSTNREVYDFWAKKTRARINDPKLKDLLAPLEPIHAFGGKRPSLEQDYYEQFNKPNVHLVSIKENPISELRPEGIVTADGRLHAVDIIAIATGFDSVTGGIQKMGIKDADGIGLSKRWDQGIYTYLGLMVSRCPNMFLPYSAHSPSVFSNGPTCIEIQILWIVEMIKNAEREGIREIDVKRQAEQAWRDEILEVANKTLLPTTNSWYMGSNIPGKPVEPLFYVGGLPRYQEKCAEALTNNLEDFIKV